MNQTQIVVLDGYALNPGDLSWDKLHELGECTIFDRTDSKDIIERSQNADIVLLNKTPLERHTLKKLPKLKYIGVLATGYNVVDIEAAREFGIYVTNVPAYGTDSVAQMVFAHILNLTQRVVHHNTTVKNGKWSNSQNWCYWDFPLMELKDKTIGIIGYGNIGSKVAEIAASFGMKILVYTLQKIKEENVPVQQCDLGTLLSKSDILNDNGSVIMEILKDEIKDIEGIPGLEASKQKEYGETHIVILNKSKKSEE